MDDPRVVWAIKKTKNISKQIEEGEMEELKRPITIMSENNVTGWSVNFPIQGTCRPSKLCVETCYYSFGMTAWTPSLRKQMWNFQACQKDPIWFAEEVVKEYHKKGAEFLRWNGGGDLFPESVDAVNHIGKNHPDVVVWVVTRIPEMASQVKNRPNIHLHFSLDKESMERQEQVMDLMSPDDDNMRDRIFFSYQTDRMEWPDIAGLREIGVSLFFFNDYEVPPLMYSTMDEDGDDFKALCPLNVRKAREQSLTGTCADCRRCFDGSMLEK